MMNKMDVFTINIEDDNKWNDIIRIYKNDINIFLSFNKFKYQKELYYINFIVETYLFFNLEFSYKYEILNISKILNITLSECILLQFLFESFSNATSIIIKKKGHILHLRNIEYNDVSNLLKKLTINIKVIKNNNLIFDAITWAGFVGIISGIKKNKYNISFNHQKNININIGIINWLIYRINPNSHFVRSILSRDIDPLLSIKEAKLYGVSYFTLTSKKFFGIIKKHNNSYVIEHGSNFQVVSDDNIIINHFNFRDDIGNNIIDLIEILTDYPVKNINTVYSLIFDIDDFLYIDY